MDRFLRFPPIERALKKTSNLQTIYEQDYLLGVRGLLVIETFLYVFLQTFVPATVSDTDSEGQTHGPLYQVILRKTLAPVFWNENLLYASFIFLSARSIAIPFIRDPSRSRVAGAVFRRGIALWFPVAVALAIVKVAFSHSYLEYILQFMIKTGNTSIEVPYFIPNAFAYFNAVFDLFWITHDYQAQAGSTAFPSQSLWIVTAIYQQSYTIYVTMIIIPYTRNRWRVQGSLFFIITAWWVQSWAWFSITGLIFADMVMNMDFKAKAQRGIPVWKTSKRCPTWIPATIILSSGLLMQYLWTAWHPDLANEEYKIHTGMYYTAGLNTEDNGRYPQARDDNYLFLLGAFLFLESSDMLQYMFNNRLFTYLGRRSLSPFSLLWNPSCMLTLLARLLSHSKHLDLRRGYQILRIPTLHAECILLRHSPGDADHLPRHDCCSRRSILQAGGKAIETTSLLELRMDYNVEMDNRG